MKKEVKVYDYFHAAFLLLEKCSIENIEAKMLNQHKKQKVVCEFTLSGAGIAQKNNSYINGEAVANILNLRRMLEQVQIWGYLAKKKFKKQSQEETQRQEVQP
jgi:hypothetical protein